MKEAKQRHGRTNGDANRETSFIANNFAYTLHIKDLIEILNAGHHALRQTNQTVESMYTKTQLLMVNLSMEQFLDKIWYNVTRQANRVLLYSIYGLHPFPLKAAINKRNDMVGHLNIMTMNLGQKLKENLFDDSLYYTTEEDLFNVLLKVFHSKLFESPVFRKVFLHI